MAHRKKLSWLALLLPVLLCCGAPVLIVAGAAIVSGVGGAVTGSLGLAAAALVLGGAIAGSIVYRRRHRAASGACCDLPRGATSNTAEKEPALRP